MSRASSTTGQSGRAAAVTAALAVALLLGAVLAHSSPVTAQQAAPPPPPVDAGYFPATGFRVSVPAFFAYFQARGGVRTFGYPVSNDFPLLGKRAQLFQRGLLQQRPDGSIEAANLLGGSFEPFVQVDGLTLPRVDPALLRAGPSGGDPQYLSSALAFLNQTVPDQWNGQTVNFLTTYLATVSCQDLANLGQDCDESLLPGYALEVWGLPTSAPQTDPDNGDFVYQRFERGVLHYSAATGETQWLLMGDWLKRVLIGTDLPPDLAAEAAGSRFFHQLALGRPLALARPSELPDTSLASAFESSTDLTVAQQNVPSAFQTATAVVQTATAIAEVGTATAVSATQTAITTSPTAAQSSLSGTATAVAVATQAQLLATLTAQGAGQQPPGVTPGPGTASAQPPLVGGPGQPGQPAVAATLLPVAAQTPVSNAGCLGDEQMFFVPRKPFIGTHVTISVTSSRRHNVQVMALGGPIDTGLPTERPGAYGWVWTWTVSPTVEAFYQFTFFADGLHPCNTSGFNAYIPLGSTATPTPTNEPTASTGPTNSPTPAVPAIALIQPASGDCSSTPQIIGSNFGTPPSGATAPSGAQVFFGGKSANIINWTNSAILIGIPSGSTSGPNSITVSIPGAGFSQAKTPFILTVPPTIIAPTSGTTASCP